MAIRSAWSTTTIMPAVNPTGELGFGRQINSAGHRQSHQAARCGEGVEAPLSQDMGGERERAEDVGEGAVAHVETAGIGAEGRHFAALTP